MLKKLKSEGAAAADAAPGATSAAKPATATAAKAAPAPAAAATAASAAAAPAASKKASKKRTLDNGLVIEDHKTGDGPAATAGKRVGVRYIGKLQNGKVFDSKCVLPLDSTLEVRAEPAGSTKGGPFTFRLGKNVRRSSSAPSWADPMTQEVIKGWDIGVIGMQVGGERKLTIPASLAYGKSGTECVICRCSPLALRLTQSQRHPAQRDPHVRRASPTPGRLLLS